MKRIIIAIDGFSACGKSTTAKGVARKLGYAYVDTGAMYRATTLYFKEHYIELTNPKAVADALQELSFEFHFNERTAENEIYLNGLNVEKQIRSMEISNLVSEVSALTEVRRHMVTLQQRMGKKKGLVMDGRDIGTVVFPQAELKIFMQADMGVRAYRRQLELLEKGQVVDLDEVIQNIQKRDLIDTTRLEGPLRKSPEAHLVDTTHITMDEQIDLIIRLATSTILEQDMLVSDI
jgi:cytidylate kinase